jgi:prolipoprotein diacylglyceryl transferase
MLIDYTRSLMTLCWIFWNPNPTIFIIPYLNHPLRWYGLLFVTGFFLGFILLLPMLRSKLQENKQFLPRDIANWPSLIASLRTAISSDQHPLKPITHYFSSEMRTQIETLQPNESISTLLQQEILSALTAFTANGNNSSRKQLAATYPELFTSIDELAYSYADKLVWFIVAGTVIGARLGHVFLYEWPRYQANPLDIIKIWEGGLASHGGTLGVMLALFCYVKMQRRSFPDIPFLSLCDLICIPTALAAVFIRLGNFMNQEIVGTPTTVPWGVLFASPAEGGGPLVRHPVQLYEAAAYFATFLLLKAIWRQSHQHRHPGFFAGIFFIAIFSFRFILEFFKADQHSVITDGSYLQAGQLLSLPFIALGVALACRSCRTSSPITGERSASH